MTVIAAAIGLDRSHAMASDSRGYGAYAYEVRPKIRHWGEWLVGSAGALLWFRFLDEAAGAIEPKTPEALADGWIAWARERGHGGQDGDHSFGVDGELLMVGPLGIRRIGSDGSIIITEERYSAAGSGAPVAIGALHALDDHEHWSPTWAVRLAAEAAVAHAPGCGGRVHVVAASRCPREEGV